ncbi:14 kDa fatty acid-binding protein-like [Argonauta hians]
MSIDLFRGVWKQGQEAPENFEAFIQATGVYTDKIDQLSKIRFITDFNADGDTWTCKISVEGMPESKVYTFKFDEPYSSTDLMGSTFTCVVTKVADNQIKETVTEWSESELVTTRTVEDDGTMTAVTSCKGVSYTAKFTKA